MWPDRDPGRQPNVRHPTQRSRTGPRSIAGTALGGLALVAATMVLAGCPSGSQQLPPDTSSPPQTVVVISEVPAPTPAPTAAPAPTTVVVIQQQSPQTVVRVVPEQAPTAGAVVIPSYVAEGDYCKWLGANGYTYSQAQATFNSLGRPSHMDADNNGIPCETVYR
ncbi:exported hypothetical protein [Candidatus Microthrix parvicella RN1]|jgi:hypothetical protein|uniref:Excalibur calcium-binding domain-containing protein n=1 Tax=Candidatus Neomicrothrix parvicella RN1 TaxID=1229780 RepID=R4Z2V1_9ACTN|nr:exported hypothetical protein [Candidatus Microthrix parvicella RN1]